MGGDEPGAEFEGDLPGGFFLEYAGASGPRLRALHAPSPGRGDGQGPAQGADLPLPHEASVAFAHPPRDLGHARAAPAPARVGEKLSLLKAEIRGRDAGLGTRDGEAERENSSPESPVPSLDVSVSGVAPRPEDPRRESPRSVRAKNRCAADPGATPAGRAAARERSSCPEGEPGRRIPGSPA